MGKIVGLIVKKPALVCPVCGKDYKSEDTLKKHIAEKHPEYKGPENKDA